MENLVFDSASEAMNLLEEKGFCPFDTLGNVRDWRNGAWNLRLALEADGRGVLECARFRFCAASEIDKWCAEHHCHFE